MGGRGQGCLHGSETPVTPLTAPWPLRGISLLHSRKTRHLELRFRSQLHPSPRRMVGPVIIIR